MSEGFSNGQAAGELRLKAATRVVPGQRSEWILLLRPLSVETSFDRVEVEVIDPHGRALYARKLSFPFRVRANEPTHKNFSLTIPKAHVGAGVEAATVVATVYSRTTDDVESRPWAPIWQTVHIEPARTVPDSPHWLSGDGADTGVTLLAIIDRPGNYESSTAGALMAGLPMVAVDLQPLAIEAWVALRLRHLSDQEEVACIQRGLETATSRPVRNAWIEALVRLHRRRHFPTDLFPLLRDDDMMALLKAAVQFGLPSRVDVVQLCQHRDPAIRRLAWRNARDRARLNDGDRKSLLLLAAAEPVPDVVVEAVSCLWACLRASPVDQVVDQLYRCCGRLDPQTRRAMADHFQTLVNQEGIVVDSFRPLVVSDHDRRTISAWLRWLS